MTGRIRTVKPEWLSDELLASASDEARVLSVALILMSDDYGLGRAALAEIAAGGWRYALEKDDGAHAPEILAKVSRALRELVAIRFVRLYTVSGQRYFAIRNWGRHQKVDHPAKRRLPEPPPEESEANSATREEPRGPSRGSREGLGKVSREPRERSGPPTSDLRPPTRTTTGTDVRALEEHCARTLCERYREHTGKPWHHPDQVVEALSGMGIRALVRAAEQVRALASWASANDAPETAFAGLLDAFFADGWAREQGYPVAVLASEPARFLAARRAAQPSPESSFKPVDLAAAARAAGVDLDEVG